MRMIPRISAIFDYSKTLKWGLKLLIYAYISVIFFGANFETNESIFITFGTVFKHESG